jgi:predicted DNA-binding mobile mystery protein A
MRYWDKKVVWEQLDKKLDSLKAIALSGAPKQGWIKTIREALGLSARQLGEKTGIDQSRISRLENAEKDGSLKLSSLQKIAKGLNMRFVYAFVPETTLEQMIRSQANKIAMKRLKKLNNTMRLEKQELSSEERKKALEDMVEQIMIDQPKDFWDESDE